MNVLIVDDQRSARHVMRSIVTRIEGVSVFEAEDLSSARRVLAEQRIDSALVDIRLSPDTANRDGLVLIREIRERSSAASIVVTAYQEMSEIREAMRSGAYAYVVKDELCDELVLPILETLRSQLQLEDEVSRLRARGRGPDYENVFIGTSPTMDRLRAMVRRVAASDRPALILGPTGAGKELVAQALHALGPAPDEPLVDINCGAIPSELIESQLFGHEKGSFTGAVTKKVGDFEAAGGGTLFLDEVAELPPVLQAKLLRVLETRQFRPVGSERAPKTFRARIVAATLADLDQRVKQGTFRSDLYFRLNVLTIRVPPLKEHLEDVPALVAHFLRSHRRTLRFSNEAIGAMQAQAWPGNVRELRNLVDRIAVLTDEEVVSQETVLRLLEGAEGSTALEQNVRQLVRLVLTLSVENKLEFVERSLIGEAMSTSTNKSEAARKLGIHRKALERRLSKESETAGIEE